MSTSSTLKQKQVVELSVHDLTPQGSIACPNPQNPLPKWASHPRIFLDLSQKQSATCLYCGTTYRLRDGESFVAGH